MTESAPPSAPGPLLRTLAPLLRGLAQSLRAWLDRPKVAELSAVRHAELTGQLADLDRQSAALDVERPLLVVMLMGGTGVGKSTLMNALAGDSIAQSSPLRPTTREPVVYYHQSVPAASLDPALRRCRLVGHDRESLRQKVLIDTPDLDSNDLENRERLAEVLPAADVVVYVGSQEKYHDRVGWELFKEQKRRRAFAFVLNKWDRCVAGSAVGPGGVRPDADLLRGLAAEGFPDPKLFRTTAQAWVDAQRRNLAAPPAGVEGEQFAELRDWLELGLTRLEVEAVKARGVSQLLAQVADSLAGAVPPDYSLAATKTEAAWDAALAEEAAVQAETLVGTLEPYSHEIERHFAARGTQRFRGLMAGYLRLTTKLRYAGSSLRERVPLSPGSAITRTAGRVLGGGGGGDDWSLPGVVQTSARAAGERVVRPRLVALANKLLLEADARGMPLSVLSRPTLAASRQGGEDDAAGAVLAAIQEAESQIAEPTGWRRAVRAAVGFLGNVLPEAVLVGAIILLLWRFFLDGLAPEFFHVLLPLYVTLGVCVALHVLILVALPVRWAAVRGEVRSRLERILGEQLRGRFGVLPRESAGELARERAEAEALLARARDVQGWLLGRERAARVAGLYGQTQGGL